MKMCKRCKKRPVCNPYSELCRECAEEEVDEYIERFPIGTFDMTAGEHTGEIVQWPFPKKEEGDEDSN